MERRIGYGLAVGDEHSHGPSFESEAEADREGQAIANEQEVDVTVFRFEAHAISGSFLRTELLRVLRPQRET
jgi:hypothetical protein